MNLSAISLVAFAGATIAAYTGSGRERVRVATAADSLTLVQMVQDRARAMNHKDVAAIGAQYSDDFTFITSAGLYLTRQDMERYDSGLLLQADSTRYQIGSVVVRILDSTNALVYYAWRVDRYRAANSTLNELGLMTLLARKAGGQWRWAAVTNLSTRVFIDDITKHRYYPQ